MKTGLVLLAAVLALSSATTMNRRCLPPVGKVPFDADKFAGEWWVVAGKHVNSPMRGVPSCVRATFAATRDANGAMSTSLAVDAKVDGAESRRLGQSVGAPLGPGRESVVLAHWQGANKDKDNTWAGVSRQSVLASDYKTFAVFYACRPIYMKESDSFDVREVVDVWSRTPKMDAKLLDVLKVVLAGYNLPADGMMEVDNSNC